MESLFPPLLVALLSEIGGKTQLLTALLAVRYRLAWPILIGVGAAAIGNSLISAACGRALHQLINFRAIGLMTGLSFILAGAGSLWRPRPPSLPNYGSIGIAATSGLAFFIAGFGDKTQFITMTLAARTDSLWLTGFGAAAGILLANIPAAIFGMRLQGSEAIARIRQGASILFIIVGIIITVGVSGLTSF